MAPVTENAVPDIIIMRNLHIVEQNDIFQFGAVADHAVVADQRASADKRAGTDFRLMADNGRRPDIVVGIDFGILGNPDVFADFIEFVSRKGLAEFDDEFLDFARVWVRSYRSFVFSIISSPQSDGRWPSWIQ